MQIQAAQLKDVPQIIELVKVVLEEMELPALHELSDSQLTQLFEKTFSSPEYQGQLADLIVAKQDDEVLGMMFGYVGKYEQQLFDVFPRYYAALQIPKTTKIFWEPEADADEWYLNTLCVAEAHRGKGIGTKLLNYLPTVAKQAHTKEVGLLVDFENPEAAKLYERVGFKNERVQVVANHHYYHLKKRV
ncbi:GNAT family N-acetyltransferase [Pediococcus cellicola]|uniref:Acetyltransferase n=1 Tax=Pediococcus cellicola TaxID=319652 RepID=A0A0R2IUS5_9LACO|nr:GNAT family N-acetyltransferase [Pediococcus cellicola]KRN66677.1 acetyltransferase [Pediococcus cellicola]GEL14679.1 N-acetyltransferase [Pediococcus cellicola]